MQLTAREKGTVVTTNVYKITRRIRINREFLTDLQGSSTQCQNAAHNPHSCSHGTLVSVAGWRETLCAIIEVTLAQLHEPRTLLLPFI